MMNCEVKRKMSLDEHIVFKKTGLEGFFGSNTDPEPIIMHNEPNRMPYGDSYIGRGGGSYPTLEALEEANKAYGRRMLQYIGRGGGSYPTLEALEEANKAYGGRLFPRKDPNDRYR